MPDKDIPPCMITIDREGRWYYKGAEMIHREFIRLFYENLSRDSLGRYIITWAGEQCVLDVEDTPFVIRKAFLRDESDGPRFMLLLSDDMEEALLPDTLYVGKENVLYCLVKNRAFPGRFSRPAYYQLAAYLEEEEGRFFLPLNGQRYLVRQ
ncbi:MAG: DUF1285 domain-containing protein [Deltaproteobacteria bacterium]|nr:DUF1285 domain-containing protein [Deltaproteobacteria bacterium]